MKQFFLLGLAILAVGAHRPQEDAKPKFSVRATDESAKEAVVPGKVKWHDSFDDAVAAAKKSGRPVFLFQLFGDFDGSLC